MNLCISGKFDLDTMEKWVNDKFSPVVNFEVNVPDLGVPAIFPKENMSRIINVVPVKDKDIMTMLFVLPYCEKNHNTQPLKYFSHLIGHEGKNSLLSYLKQEDLALELGSCIDHLLDCFTQFEIEITLT